MLRKFLAIATVLAPFSGAFSQDSTAPAAPEEKKLTISGSVDAYYRFNFANAKDSARTNNYTSFTNSQNSFEVGMASVKLGYNTGKVGLVADLGFGTRAAEFAYAESGILAAIKQAYVTYSPSDKVTFTMGKFATHVGYELLDPQLNRNYSMDYMFSYGPFSHTGLKADINLSDNFGFMLGVANPTDLISAPFEKKFFLAQVHGGTENFSAYLNYVGGKDMSDVASNQFDLVLTGKVSDKFSVGYNGTVKSAKYAGSSASWWGSALYLNVDPTDKFGFTLRGEVFDDKKGVAGFYTSLFDATLSLNIKPSENFTIIPEFRLDSSKDPLFYKNSDTDSPTSKGTGSFILAAIYSF
jgi:hypothetical protein